jgi:hypothetical protein
MKRFILATLLVGTLAYAVPAPNLDPAPGTYVGQRTTITNRSEVTISITGNTLISFPAAVTLLAGKSVTVVWNGTNWVSTSAGATAFGKTATFTFDFGPLSSNALEANCEETPVIAVTGGVVRTDFCQISSNLATDGGSALAAEATLTCRASVDGVRGKLCVTYTDGGSYNLGDAGFNVRVTR